MKNKEYNETAKPNGSGKADFMRFIGVSEPMRDIYRLLKLAAPSSATIFVTGESGTGKELCAEALHKLSGRSHDRLVSINSSAIPRDLIESEIFGHVRGAFTGAVAERDGAAIMADGGTLFLDEICEMDLDLQVKLLRFVQTGIVNKVGGSSPRKVDVRIVCATNKDPMEEVRAGRFREDLYYRLHVVPVHLPPLRERGEDIIHIANSFLQRMAKAEGKAFGEITANACDLLRNYHWPGNVRELENVIHNIVVMNKGGPVCARMLPMALARSQRDMGMPPKESVSALAQMLQHNFPKSPCTSAGSCNPPETVDNPEIRPFWLEEKEIIERAIKICNGNIVIAAVRLGISPSTIYRKRLSWQKKDAA